MPLENATFISQLDAANPAAPDLMADTDNHLRLIKQVLKNTFPNFTGVVTPNQNELKGFVPIGGIVLWSGAINAIPSGWVLCAGQTGISRTDGAGTINAPNLMDRFVVGAGSTYAVGATGGSVVQTGTTDSQGAHAHSGTTDSKGSHSHGGVTADHVLTIAELPRHDHPIKYSNGTSINPSGSGLLRGSVTDESSVFINTTGGGFGHSHGIQTDGSHNHVFTSDTQGAHTHTVTTPDGRPPYYALAYIMKV